MPTTEQVFLALLRSELTGEAPPTVVPNEELLKLSAKHDLSHLVADALDKQSALGADTVSQALKKQRYRAVLRYEQLNYELEAVNQCFAEARLPFIPLKGAVIRAYYPEPWMRTSCDIDILVHPEDVDRAVQLLCDKLGYQYKGKGTHDVSLFAPCGLHVELHFDTVEQGRASKANEVLSHVWEHTEGEIACRMSDAMFYFYHIAHMAKHVEEGGCGVRSFMDLWLLMHAVEYDKAERRALLESGGLARFAEAAEQLADYWFSGAEPSSFICDLEEFILHGGAYGTVATRTAVHQHKNGRWKTLWETIIPPYSDLKLQYPVLQTKSWLYPFYVLYRIGTKLQRKERKLAGKRLQQMTSVGNEERRSVADLLNGLGLSE